MTLSKSISIDRLNLVLLLLSAAVAVWIPFELFLFSYAVLGPLHYLTEIGWLHQRRYFTQAKGDGWLLAVLGFLGVLLAVVLHIQDRDPKHALLNTTLWYWTYHAFAVLAGFTVVAAAVFALLPYAKRQLALALGAAGAVLGYAFLPAYGVFLLLLPTLIHVYLFTALFMWYGAIKSRSKLGYANAALMVVLGIWVCFLPEDFSRPALPQSLARITATSFDRLPQIMGRISGVIHGTLDAGQFLRLQRLVAFAYTYHYLNWFSKTRIIRWHEVSKTWIWVTLLVWLASVALYAVDYRTGFVALLLLSYLHVVLELPLNAVSIRGILQAFRTGGSTQS
jgi:hypothetical protein